MFFFLIKLTRLTALLLGIMCARVVPPRTETAQSQVKYLFVKAERALQLFDILFCEDLCILFVSV